MLAFALPVAVGAAHIPGLPLWSLYTGIPTTPFPGEPEEPPLEIGLVDLAGD